jgi:hypothetical protein
VLVPLIELFRDDPDARRRILSGEAAEPWREAAAPEWPR